MLITRWQAPIVPAQEQISKMLEAEGLRPYIEIIEKRTEIKDHRHPFDEVRMVASGQMLLNVAGNQLLLRPGDKIVVPSNTRHSKRVDANEDCICVCGQRL